MPNVTVATHVDDFMQSASKSEARKKIGAQGGRSFATVAALTAADVTDIDTGDAVQLLGYYAAGNNVQIRNIKMGLP